MESLTVPVSVLDADEASAGLLAPGVLAGMLGLPLMVAIIGGEPKRFRPLIDGYREAGRRARHPVESYPLDFTPSAFWPTPPSRLPTTFTRDTRTRSPRSARNAAGRRPPGRQGSVCVKTVSKLPLLGALELYLSEKQMPQVVGFIRSGQNQESFQKG
jgi:hypothetical protein